MEQGIGMGPPGRMLGGRYRVGNQLGSGGYGRLWEAYDEVLDRRVAVGSLGREGMVESARRSVHVIAATHHPNLVTVHDFVEVDGVVWYVMPLVSGPSLAEYLAENGPMSGGQVREVAKALLDALAALHRAQYVHGDVRPANILAAGREWMLLPGIDAMVRDDDSDTTGHVAWIVDAAAVDYLAPDRLRGAPQEPSNDLFSLGVTLYQLVTGRLPFHRDDVAETVMAAAYDEPLPLGRTDELGHLIEGLLDKNPARRLTAAQARQLLPRTGGGPLLASSAPAAASVSADTRASSTWTPPKHKPALHARSAPRPASGGKAAGAASSLVLLAVLAVVLVQAAAQAHVAAGDVSDFFLALLPWVLLALGACVLAVQVRVTLTRRRTRAGNPVPVWRRYARLLAPPPRWTNEERALRRTIAERTVDGALLAIGRRMASAQPGPGADKGDH